MEKMASINWPDLHLIFLLTVCALLPNSAADQHYLGHYCPDDAIFAPDNQYGTNLNTLLASLSSNAAEDPRGFFEKTENDTVYGLYLCRGDLNTSSCSDCVNNATLELPAKYCPNIAEAIIWYEGCMVRYSSKSFFGKSEVFPGILAWNTHNFTDNNATVAQFGDAVRELMRNASSQAAMGGSEKKFSTISYNFSRSVTLYSLAQCTPDLSQKDCDHCLTYAISKLPISEGGRALLPSCNFRYEIYPFFKDLDAAPPTGGKPVHRIPNLSASPPASPASHMTGGAKKKVVAISVAISLPVFIIVLSGFI
uniref:Gnk2-homologous domain-containing protein n=1 Tax=Opuntia streptacantha TaxID=393608 RepID=A0A7C8YVY9_OPUST